MDLGAMLLLLAVFILVGMFLAAPLMRRSRSRAADESPEVSALLAERDRVINALQELDFDFKLGKVPADAYPEQRQILLQKGADVLKTLDALVPAPSSGLDANARVERAVASRGEAQDEVNVALPDERIESMLAARRAARRERSAGFCPHCGKPILVNDRFCPSCGKALQLP